MNWKQNILTRTIAFFVVGAWCYVAWISYASRNNPESFGLFAFLFVLLPAAILAFFQIVISIIRWKKLSIFDKLLFVLMLILFAWPISGWLQLIF